MLSFYSLTSRLQVSFEQWQIVQFCKFKSWSIYVCNIKRNTNNTSNIFCITITAWKKTCNVNNCWVFERRDHLCCEVRQRVGNRLNAGVQRQIWLLRLHGQTALKGNGQLMPCQQGGRLPVTQRPCVGRTLLVYTEIVAIKPFGTGFNLRSKTTRDLIIN